MWSDRVIQAWRAQRLQRLQKQPPLLFSGCRGWCRTSSVWCKASCWSHYARQVLLTAAIKNVPISLKKHIVFPANAFFFHSLFHSSPVWHNPKVQNVQMNKWQAWHSISVNSHWDSKWYSKLLGSEHTSEDPSICLTNHTWNWDFCCCCMEN